MKSESEVPVSTPSRAFPRSRDVLVMLLEEVQRFINVADGFQQRQRYRSETLRQVQADPLRAAAQRQVMVKAAGEESRKHWAQGLPSIRSLVPHADQSQLDDLLRQREKAIELLNVTPFPRDGSDLAAWIDRLEAVVTLDERILGLFTDLRDRIEDALEGCADTCADTARKFVRVLPENPLVLRLYFEIESNNDPMKSQAVIARDFTARHGGNPANLLRGVRRLCERLRKAELLSESADTGGPPAL